MNYLSVLIHKYFFFQISRSIWELELDITAPQIIFVEQFSQQNSAMAVIDFGKLHLRNNIEMGNKTECNKNNDNSDNKNSEEDGKYFNFS